MLVCFYLVGFDQQKGPSCVKSVCWFKPRLVARMVVLRGLVCGKHGARALRPGGTWKASGGVSLCCAYAAGFGINRSIFLLHSFPCSFYFGLFKSLYISVSSNHFKYFMIQPCHEYVT